MSLRERFTTLLSCNKPKRTLTDGWNIGDGFCKHGGDGTVMVKEDLSSRPRPITKYNRNRIYILFSKTILLHEGLNKCRHVPVRLK